MNNSVCGKTMEDVRKRIDFEMVNTPERFQKLGNKPKYKHRHLISEVLVGVEKDKHTVELNKPIWVCLFQTIVKLTFWNLNIIIENKLVYTEADSYVIKFEIRFLWRLHRS